MSKTLKKSGINNQKKLNNYFDMINKSLKIGEIYKDNFESYENRNNKILNRSFYPLNKFVVLFDIFFHRIIPKIKIFKKFYFLITNGKNRAFSKAEIYGRLYYCGFEIVKEKSLNDSVSFTAKKIKENKIIKSLNYGLFIKLERLGKDNKVFQVYKIRTMSPYSEYIQNYVFNKNKLDFGGKIKDDFRISSKGKFLRKFWIDELPMIFNILKGQIKLVGVRPISKHYFSLYDKELQDLRSQNKPGFIPPFYVDLPNTLEEIMESEKKYLNSYKKHPIKTDFKYFIISLKNVLFRGVRSK